MSENSNQNSNPVQNLKEGLATITGEKGWAVSCYVPVFNVLFCVLASVKMVNSKFCLFHARQGLVLFGLWFLTIVMALISPVLSLMLWGVVLLLHASGMFIAYNMKTAEIPVIGKLAMRIPENYFFLKLTGKKLDKPEQPVQAYQAQTPVVVQPPQVDVPRAQNSTNQSGNQSEPPKTV